MTSTQIEAPVQFLPTPGDPVIPWLQWRRLFENYLLASNTVKESPERRRAILLHSLGPEGQRIFYTLPELGEAGDDIFTKAMTTLQSHFAPKVSVVAERYRFRQRAQLPHESVDNYIAALRELASRCEFGTFEDEMLRDQLVEKTNSSKIRTRLLTETDVKLDKAIKLARQCETAMKEAKSMSGGDTHTCSEVKYKAKPRGAKAEFKKEKQRPRPNSNAKCYRCGSPQHLANSPGCTARSKDCNSCGKKGHLSSVCRGKRKVVKQVEHARDTLGKVKGFKHKVKVRPEVKPVQQKLRRLPLTVRQAVSAELQRLLDAGIIKRAEAPEWVSPIVVAWKKTGKIRICVDLRKPNEAVIEDKFPLPSIEEMLSEMNGATYFSKLDLKSAYYRLELDSDSRDLTSFITHDGVFRFRTVCFGLSSAPSCFQKMMSTVLAGIPNVQCFIDDIIIYGRDKAGHYKTLFSVLTRLKERGMTLNDKCEFGVFSREGYPEELVSDNGTQLTSQEFETFLQKRNIKHRFSAVYHPEGNSTVNRILNETIQTARIDKRPVKNAVTEFLGTYRATRHATTGESPSVVLHGRHMLTLLDIIGVTTSPKQMSSVEIDNRTKAKQAKSKEAYDKRKCVKTRVFSPGDIVRIKKPWNVHKGESKFTEPVEIRQHVGLNTYVMTNGQKWNVKHLAPFLGKPTLLGRRGDSRDDHSSDFIIFPTADDSMNNNSTQLGSRFSRSKRVRNPPRWTCDYVMGTSKKKKCLLL
ncbi:uncharacterized protein K02A2.6-like [Anneissia japonica]|uniref:uncharacterized protein K02A2.6-like n=1 Tax=Anneissia japonica TaxID=1529436 RepID=UPI001425B64B|nr:uncharacterized protein K02A2.6-like [Anneissia japonica]